MRILVFGKNGKLGWELQRCLPLLGEVIALDIEDLDLCDRKALSGRIVELKPQVIVNAAAYTAVDRAEQEPEPAMQVNALAPGVMAEEARRLSAVLIHFSTDYVFDGAKGTPYTEADAPNPLNLYGRSKLEGERAVEEAGGAHLIFRTSWVYSLKRDSFVTKVLTWSRQKETLRVVTDQVGSPTWARLLAEATTLVLARCGPDPYPAAFQKRGLYHLAGKGVVSRYEWAKAILAADPHREEQCCTLLEPAQSSEFPTPAQRPAFSALDCSKFERVFQLEIPEWEISLQSAMVVA